MKTEISKSKKGDDIYVFRGFKICYASLHEPSARFYDDKFGFRLLIPKEGVHKERIDKLLKFHANIKIPQQKYRCFIMDGDNQMDTDSQPVENPKEQYFNHWTYKAKTKYAPVLRDQSGELIEEDLDNIFHGYGMYVDIWFKVVFYPNKKMGAAASNIAALMPMCLQKIRNAEDFDRAKSQAKFEVPEDELSTYTTNDEDDLPF